MNAYSPFFDSGPDTSVPDLSSTNSTDASSNSWLDDVTDGILDASGYNTAVDIVTYGPSMIADTASTVLSAGYTAGVNVADAVDEGYNSAYKLVSDDASALYAGVSDVAANVAGFGGYVFNDATDFAKRLEDFGVGAFQNLVNFPSNVVGAASNAFTSSVSNVLKFAAIGFVVYMLIKHGKKLA